VALTVGGRAGGVVIYIYIYDRRTRLAECLRDSRCHGLRQCDPADGRCRALCCCVAGCARHRQRQHQGDSASQTSSQSASPLASRPARQPPSQPDRQAVATCHPSEQQQSAQPPDCVVRSVRLVTDRMSANVLAWPCSCLRTVRFCTHMCTEPSLATHPRWDRQTDRETRVAHTTLSRCFTGQV
jgi:hypothetical protein